MSQNLGVLLYCQLIFPLFMYNKLLNSTTCKKVGLLAKYSKFVLFLKEFCLSYTDAQDCPYKKNSSVTVHQFPCPVSWYVKIVNSHWQYLCIRSNQMELCWGGNQLREAHSCQSNCMNCVQTLLGETIELICQTQVEPVLTFTFINTTDYHLKWK